jgi:Carboxypeptidase regulatory-like domain
MIAPLLVLACFFQQPASFTVSGTVVNRVTGKPLNKARVYLSDPGQDPVTTGPDGRFRFDGLKQGKYSLSVERLGYQRQAYKQKSLATNYTTGIVTGEQENTQNLVFGLIPGSVLMGTVTDTLGRPAENVSVAAIRIAGIGPRRHVQRVFYGWTDDRGMYRIASLPEGSYIVSFRGRAWYGSALPTPGPSTYPVSYFPGTTNPEAATPIQLEPGKEVPINAVLSTVPAVSVTGRLGEATARPGGSSPQLRATLTMAGPFGMELSLANSINGDSFFQFAEVGEGEYFLNVSNAQGRLVGRSVVKVGASDVTVDIPESALAQVIAKVEIRGTSKTPDRPVVVLLSEITGRSRLSLPADAQGQVHFGSVPAGDYDISVGKGEILAIQSVTIEGATETAGVLHVPETGTVNLAVIANASVAQQVNGRVVRGERPESGLLAILVPAKRWEDLQGYRFDQSDSDGTFTWRAVPPGDYLMFALEDGESADYLDAEVIRKLAPRGQPVRITMDPDQRVQVQVTSPQTGN